MFLRRLFLTQRRKARYRDLAVRLLLAALSVKFKLLIISAKLEEKRKYLDNLQNNEKPLLILLSIRNKMPSVEYLKMQQGNFVSDVISRYHPLLKVSPNLELTNIVSVVEPGFEREAV